ncbi:linear amide C-N hydrolase [Enterococcus gallinarum]|nr:linear amide C-N hydrolase [Enterococcus gallinarum]
MDRLFCSDDGLCIFVRRRTNRHATGYQWSLQLGGQVTNTYGFVGTGKQLEEFLFIDGVNEKGLTIAELYFSNEAVYCEYTAEKINLAPHELLHWVLGNVADIPDLYQKNQQDQSSTDRNGATRYHSPIAFYCNGYYRKMCCH